MMLKPNDFSTHKFANSRRSSNRKRNVGTALVLKHIPSAKTRLKAE